MYVNICYINVTFNLHYTSTVCLNIGRECFLPTNYAVRPFFETELVVPHTRVVLTLDDRCVQWCSCDCHNDNNHSFMIGRHNMAGFKLTCHVSCQSNAVKKGRKLEIKATTKWTHTRNHLLPLPPISWFDGPRLKSHKRTFERKAIYS